MRRRLLVIGSGGVLMLIATAMMARATAANLASSEEGPAGDGPALESLAEIPSKGAPDWALLGQNFYLEGRYRDAVNSLEKAVAVAPSNSAYYDWLGRAYGRRAEESNVLTAFSYANKTRAAFEKAVALDPRNLEALSDLFEYYLEAPGIVGGGLEKAVAVAEQIGRLNQAEYHCTLARLADRRKDARTAEQEFRRARELEPASTGRVLDLAGFLSRQGRFVESDELFRLARQLSPDAPRVMFARAAAYIQSGRNLPEAKQLLIDYRASHLTPDDPSPSDAARLLKRAR